jgi:2-amino-4-hydroxy-6-hydroxymethyldihydropteridine diphosphokinase
MRAADRGEYLYLLALGSNRPLSCALTPDKLIAAALEEVGRQAGEVVAVAPVLRTAPLGPSRRRFANSALLLATTLEPMALLRRLQSIERHFGRQRYRRWGERRLDIDIILWSGGVVRSKRLHIPHPAYRLRDFVLRPAMAIAPDWRDPVSSLSIRHLAARLHKPRRQG